MLRVKNPSYTPSIDYKWHPTFGWAFLPVSGRLKSLKLQKRVRKMGDLVLQDTAQRLRLLTAALFWANLFF